MSIDDSITAFIQFQNRTRGLPGEGVALDGDAYAGTVAAGQNSVTGIAGIASGATTIALGTGFNAVILDGDNAANPSGSGAHAYSYSVAANGAVTLLDENTGYSRTVTGASYLLFDGAAQNSDGSYQSIAYLAGGSTKSAALLYNAALGRQPDLPGLEYHAVRLANQGLSLHDDAANFIASPEFQARFPSAAAPSDHGGPNDQAFVTALYQNVLHRTPAASELAYYMSDIQGTLPGIAAQDRAQILVNMAMSPENQHAAGWLIDSSAQAYSAIGMGMAGVAPKLLPTVAASDLLSQGQKAQADTLISYFENSTPVIQYGYFAYLDDGRGYTIGRAGFTTRDGDFYQVVVQYTQAEPNNPLAPFLPVLKQLADSFSSSVSGLTGLAAAVAQAAPDPVFQHIQDISQDAFSYIPAMAMAQAIGLKTALGRAELYDAVLQHGFGTDPDGAPTLVDKATAMAGGIPAIVGDQAWLTAFLTVRQADLLNPYAQSTQVEWSQSTDRVTVFRDLMALGDWDLSKPETFDSKDNHIVLPGTQLVGVTAMAPHAV